MSLQPNLLGGPPPTFLPEDPAAAALADGVDAALVTRAVADHMFKNYDGVLKIDGEVGNKKQYDPRAWGKLAEAGMAARVVRACEDLRSAGTKMP